MVLLYRSGYILNRKRKFCLKDGQYTCKPAKNRPEAARLSIFKKVFNILYQIILIFKINAII
jgi:hypothetical protein